MKIRNSSRITAIVLALVMLLPLISIPTFAAPTAEQTLYMQDFSSYADLDQAGLKDKINKEWFFAPANLEAGKDGSNTFLRFPMGAYIAPGSEYDTDCYVYTDNYSKFQAMYPNYTIFSIDVEANKLTISSADPENYPDIVLDVDNTGADLEAGYYGKVSYASTNAKDNNTWKVATGEYAACIRFGDGYVMDKYAHLYFGEKTFYTEEDIEVIQGTKKVGDLKSNPAGFSAAEYGKVIVSYSAFIEPGSAGQMNMQLNKYYDANGAEYNFTDLFNVELATGACTGVFAGKNLPIGEWFELSFIVDLVGGTISGMLDGEVCGLSAAKATNITVNGFSISKIFKQSPKNIKGAWCVDNFAVYTGDAASGMVKYKDYHNDFESATVGGSVPGFSGMNAAYKIAEKDGSKVWALGVSSDGTGALDQNARPNHSAWTKEMCDYLTLEYDLYITSDVYNQFQTQFVGNTYTVTKADGSTGNGGWGDIFCVRNHPDTGATIGREGNPAMYPVPTDEWFTISVEFDLANNYYDIYVNGSLVIPGQSVNDYKSIIIINSNAVTMGKENKAANSWRSESGYWYLDNISFVDGTYDAELPSEWNIFEDLLSVDNYEIWDGLNEEIRDAFINASYSNPTELFPIYDDNGQTYALQLDIKATADAEAGLAESNVDLMVRPAHPGYSKNAFDQVILSADYVVSEDAEGCVEVQLFNAHKFAWTHLAVIDTTNANVSGVAFEKGEEFNITTVVDLKAGTFNVYYENFLVNSGTIAADGLSAGEWSIAKVMKEQPAYAGNIVITDANITLDYADDKAENDLYLYEQENMKTIDASILTAVKAASIRLSDPTGLRFATEIDAEALMEVYSANIKVGTVIAPADYVAAAGAFTKEALETLGYATNYLDIAAEVGNWYQGGNTTGALADGTYFTASIVNILDENLTRDFAAIGYVEYTVNGETVTLYCDEYHVANVADIAASALATGEYDAYADILNAYIAE